jgi:hypothetical protein
MRAMSSRTISRCVRTNCGPSWCVRCRRSIVELAKEQKIDLILSEGLVYSNPRIDISELVIERLKQEFKKK